MKPARNRIPAALFAAGAFAFSFGVVAQTATPASPATPAGASAPCATPPCGPGGPGAGRPGPRAGHRAPMFRHLDADGDGQVSRAELQAAHQRQLEQFDKADANGDGKLSAEEFRPLRGAWGDGPMRDRPRRQDAPQATPKN